VGTDPLDDGTWDIDRRLWVVSRNETGLGGYITGGGFTFPGRFYVFWTNQRAAYSTSLSDIGTCSVESSYWLHGFLVGQHPGPWFSKAFDKHDDSDPRYQIYESALQMFTLTGVWRTRSEPVFCCAQCGSPFHPENPLPRALPSNPAGEVCFTCHPVSLDGLWPRVSEGPPPFGT
jgi:hypothetical protein